MSDIQDPIQSEGSSDSFQSFLAKALAGAPVDLPDVAAPEVPAGSPRKTEGLPGSETQSQSDTGAGRDGGPGQQVNMMGMSSHHSSAGGTCSDTPPPEMHNEGRGRGRGRGRRAKRTSNQETAQQRAHRRFYERKKQKLAALEQEAAETLALYQRLQRENADLRRKYEALTCTIAGREQQMTLLEAMGSLCINTSSSSQPAISSQDTAAAAAAAAACLDLPAAPHFDFELLLQQQQQRQQEDVKLGQLPASVMLSMHRCSDSAPTALWPSQQQQQQLPRHIAAAGPFGRAQLQAQDSPAAAAVQPYAWQQPVHELEQQLPQQRLQQVQQPPMQQQHMQQQQHLMQQQQQQGLNIQRSVSMPAPAPTRYSPSDPGSSSAAAAAAAGQPSFVMGCNLPRAYSSSPYGWCGDAGFGQQQQLPQQQQQQVPQAWTAGPSRLQQATSPEIQQQQQQQHFAPQQFASQQQQQQQEQHGLHVRPHSWSGPASPNSMSMAAPPAMHRSSQSFPSASPPAHHSSSVLGYSSPPQQPFLLQQQFLAGPEGLEAAAAASSLPAEWQQQQQRHGFTITTAGPAMAMQQHHQQQQQLMHRSGSDPTAAYTRHQLLGQQQQQQWQWQQPMQGFPMQQQQPEMQLPQFALPDLPPVQQQYGQQQQDMPAAAAAAVASGGLGDFGSLLSVPADDLMMVDDDLLQLLENQLSSQQQSLPQQQQQQQAPMKALLAAAAAEGDMPSGDLLPSLQSIPSAGADLAAAAAAGSMPVPQQQQQQQQEAAAAAAGSPPETLLMASRLLQARHEAAGYFPAAAAAASGEADFVYVHQVVEWYRSQLSSLAELLPRVDRPLPDVAAGLALVQAVEQLLMGVRKFSTRNRVGLWELKLINLESGDFQEAPPNHWRSVLHSISFSREAREKLDACFILYKDHMAKARAERQEVLREMAALTAELHGSSDNVTVTNINVTDPAAAGPFAAAVAGVSSSSGFGMQQQQQQQGEAPRSLQFRNDGFDRWQDVLEKLQVSLQREHMVANMIMYSCAQAATHVQMAKAMLHSWPYWPNGYCMLTILHEEEQAAAAAAAAGRPVWPEPVSRMRSI